LNQIEVDQQRHANAGTLLRYSIVAGILDFVLLLVALYARVANVHLSFLIKNHNLEAESILWEFILLLLPLVLMAIFLALMDRCRQDRRQLGPVKGIAFVMLSYAVYLGIWFAFAQAVGGVGRF